MLRVVLAAWMLAVPAFAAQIVDGHVVNSVTGVDLSGVSVNLQLPESGGNNAYSARTDGQGRFHIDDVKDGSYSARYAAPGFWPIPNFPDGNRAAFVVSGAGDPVHLEIRMEPIPKVAGRVLDGTGKPVPNASLWLLWENSGCQAPSCFPFVRETRSDSKGEYTFGDPDVPGTWLLSAAAPSSWKPPEPREGRTFGWAQTFYPGVADPQLATRIAVAPGADLGILQIKLVAVPVRRVRGVLVDPHGDPVAKGTVELGRDVGQNLHTESKDDGLFEFDSVAEGEWRISSKMERDGVALWVEQPLLVKNHDLEHLELRLIAPFAIQGKVVGGAGSGVLMAFNSGITRPFRPPRTLSGKPDGNGDFTIGAIYPGPYQILVGSTPAGSYLDSIRLGGREAFEWDVPILSGALPITVTFKPGGGMVRGVIEGCGSARVLLVPREPVLRRSELVRQASCSATGQFEFSSVRPGEYYGFAIQEGDTDPWYGVVRDESVLNRAGKITVRDNETSTGEIRVIRLR